MKHTTTTSFTTRSTNNFLSRYQFEFIVAMVDIQDSNSLKKPHASIASTQLSSFKLVSSISEIQTQEKSGQGRQSRDSSSEFSTEKYVANTHSKKLQENELRTSNSTNVRALASGTPPRASQFSQFKAPRLRQLRHRNLGSKT